MVRKAGTFGEKQKLIGGSRKKEFDEIQEKNKKKKEGLKVDIKQTPDFIPEKRTPEQKVISGVEGRLNSKQQEIHIYPFRCRLVSHSRQGNYSDTKKHF